MRLKLRVLVSFIAMALPGEALKYPPQRGKGKLNEKSKETSDLQSKSVLNFLNALHKSGYVLSQSSPNRFIVPFETKAQRKSIEKLCRRYNFLGLVTKIQSAVSFVDINTQLNWYIWSGLGHDELKEFVKLAKMPIPNFACSQQRLFSYKFGMLQQQQRYFERLIGNESLSPSDTTTAQTNKTPFSILNSFIQLKRCLNREGKHLLPHIGAFRREIADFLKTYRGAQIVSDSELRQRLLSSLEAEVDYEIPTLSPYPIYRMQSITLGISIDMISANFNVLSLLESVLEQKQDHSEDIVFPEIEGPSIPGSWVELLSLYRQGQKKELFRFFEQAVNFRHEVINSLGYDCLLRIQERIVALLAAYLKNHGIQVSGTNGSDELIIPLNQYQLADDASENLHYPSKVHVERLKQIQELVSSWRFGKYFRVTLFRTYPIFPVPRSSCYPYILEHWKMFEPEDTMRCVSAHLKHLPSQWHSAVVKWLLRKPWNVMDRIFMEQGTTVRIEEDDILEVIG